MTPEKSIWDLVWSMLPEDLKDSLQTELDKSIDQVRANVLAMQAGEPDLMNQGFTEDEMKDILKNSTN